MNYYNITSLPEVMDLGKQTETGAREIRIDCTPWLVRWPGLAVSILATPPGGAGAYTAATRMEGTEIVWPVSEADTVYAGEGAMEVLGQMDGVRKLSATCRTRILASSAANTTEPPDPAEPWLAQVEAMADRATSQAAIATSAKNSANRDARAAEAAAEDAAAAAEEAKVFLADTNLCESVTGTATIDGDTLGWDGDLDAMPVLISQGSATKWAYVSDNVPTADQLAAGFQVYYDNTNAGGDSGGEKLVSGVEIVSEDANQIILGIPYDTSYVRIIKKPCTIGSLTFERAGVYVMAYSTLAFVSRFIITGYTWTPATKDLHISDKYIPKTVQRVGEPLYLYDANGKKYQLSVSTSGVLSVTAAE